MRADFDKRWLLPFGILLMSALVALGIVVLEPPFADPLSKMAQQGTNETTQTSSEVPTTACSGASATDYICYQ